jgi:hypothetical protein
MDLTAGILDAEADGFLVNIQPDVIHIRRDLHGCFLNQRIRLNSAFYTPKHSSLDLTFKQFDGGERHRGIALTWAAAVDFGATECAARALSRPADRKVSSGSWRAIALCQSPVSVVQLLLRRAGDPLGVPSTNFLLHQRGAVRQSDGEGTITARRTVADFLKTHHSEFREI